MGRLLLMAGFALVVVGVLVLMMERGGAAGWRMPGDLSWGGRGWRVSFPIGTSILVSVVLTVLLNLALWLFRRN